MKNSAAVVIQLFYKSKREATRRGTGLRGSTELIELAGRRTRKAFLLSSSAQFTRATRNFLLWRRRCIRAQTKCDEIMEQHQQKPPSEQSSIVRQDEPSLVAAIQGFQTALMSRLDALEARQREQSEKIDRLTVVTQGTVAGQLVQRVGAGTTPDMVAET
mmetsp:Transcript_47911/g.103990  ORF Transcript_47911/g.103990 Transcript_47911/m.103990 type:complete len:160 (-) Transcript_47911:50-529(-)